MDGASPSVYDKYRKGGDFTTLVTNIKLLVSERKKQIISKPYIELVFLVMRENENEIDGMIKLAKDLGVDKLSFKRVSLLNNSDRIMPFIPPNPFFIYPIREDNYKRRKLCRVAWESMVINSNGEVVPCCQDFLSLEVMGNIFTEPLGQIWNGRRYISFRKGVCLKTDKITLCKDWCGEKLYEAEIFVRYKYK